MDDSRANLPPAVTEDQKRATAARFATIQELVVESRRKLSADLWDYVSGGAESETTMARNRQALDSVAFRPRVLRNVSKIDTSTTLLGCKLRLPVFIAPLGGLTLLDPNGTVAVTRAAASRDSMVFQSSVSLPDMEVSAPAAAERFVFQLYIHGDREWVDAFVQRAVNVGARALCLTVDTAAYSRRERNLINRFDGTAGGGRHRVMSNVGRDNQAAFDWAQIARLRDKFRLPIIIKGIATAEDAALAVEHGVSVVYISNHGGRQLDHGQGTLDMLPAIVDAVRGKAEIVVDGGFVRGTDVLKAIALGARAVGLGKLLGWSLSAAGEAGVGRMFDIIEDEITKDMMMLGVTSLAQLDKAYVYPATPVVTASALSAFPNVDPDGRWRR